MASTTITFEKDDVQPPVFVAGSFTDWSPIEMTHETTESNGSIENVFSYKASLSPGEYQYKFRLGAGDWWVLDESGRTATDDNGNMNNVLLIEASKPKTSFEERVEIIPTTPVQPSNTRDAYTKENEPSATGFPEQAKPSEPFPPPDEVAASLTGTHTAEETAVQLDVPELSVKKQVQFDEHTGKITADVISNRKDSIPDFAPPPYSVATNGTIGNPAKEDQSVAKGQKQAVEIEAAKPASEQKQPPFLGRLSGRGLLTIIAIIAVPVAVSYCLRR